MLPEKIDPDIAEDAVVDGTPVDNAPLAPEVDAVDADEASAAALGDSPDVVPTEPETSAESTQPTEELAVAASQQIKPAQAPPAAHDDPHHWDGPSIPFVPHHALVEGIMALAFLTVVLILVAMMPAPLEGRANPFLSPEGVKPEWYFMAPFELLHLLPPLIGMLVTGAAVGVLIGWPFIDRRPRRITRRPFMMGLSFAIILTILALTIYPYIHEG
jgi:hypothetical protein